MRPPRFFAHGRTIVHMTALGVALLLIGAIVVTVEAHVPSLGMLGGPGVVALGVGSVLAVSGLGGGIALGLVAALVLVTSSVAILALSLHKGLAVRGRRIKAGPEGLIGHVGVVHSWADRMGNVLVDGALWRARFSWPDPDDPDEPHELHAGDPVVVERLTGLTLGIRRAEDWELTP
jgi:membrane-bound ClpP family serine protease